MVTNATNLSRSGLSDWIIQRFSAVLLGSYTVFLLVWFLLHPELDYAQWRGLFDATAMRLFSLITLAALCGHAWIGMWTVGTDYLTPSHAGSNATAIRLVYQAGCVLLIAVYLLWGIEIFWGS
ncbi:MAG: succinate dehydrogenase, hydrophobic membrane anchor protein [Pseudohongiellaceae bacterium]|jgi:succinate dehydrogenase / fumarate reductase membrane anchor subunit